MTEKATLIWVARHPVRKGNLSFYGIWLNKRKPKKRPGGSFYCGQDTLLCPHLFHRAFPTIHLKPGEGPYRYELPEPRRVEEK